MAYSDVAIGGWVT